MAKVPIEDLLKVGSSTYEVVKAAALEARRLNHLRLMQQPEGTLIPAPEEKKGPEEKVTTLALRRLIEGRVRIVRKQRGS